MKIAKNPTGDINTVEVEKNHGRSVRAWIESETPETITFAAYDRKNPQWKGKLVKAKKDIPETLSRFDACRLVEAYFNSAPR